MYCQPPKGLKIYIFPVYMNTSLTKGSFFYVCMCRHITIPLIGSYILYTQPHHAKDLKGQAQEFNILAPRDACREGRLSSRAIWNIIEHSRRMREDPRGQILERNPDKSLESFLPSLSPVQLCLEISISSNLLNLLQFLQFSYCTL
jgi:hypothetical protein